MILDFGKPKKIKSTDEHNAYYSSDSGVAGTYVSNMSDRDKNKWKAKHIKGKHERIEIRTEVFGSNVLIKVYNNIQDIDWRINQEEWYHNHKNIKISMNGPVDMTFDGFQMLNEAINEAREILNK